MEHKVVTDYTNVAVDNENVKVYVRARPPEEGHEMPKDMFSLPPEKPQRKLVIRDISNRSYGEHAFLFDRVFWTDDDQETVYNDVAVKLINHCMDGYNSCCFAYGQTGSGKTYSMFGESGENRGIIPRSVEQIFSVLEDRSRTKEVAVLVSFCEMYCDMIRDLGKAYLDKSSRPDAASRQKTSDWFDRGKVTAASFNTTKDPYLRQNLEIHEDADGNVFVKDLSVIPVTTPEEVVTIMHMGFRLRATHETKMNAVSSRSHTVFTITIVQKDKATGETVTGMLNLVDLAGSERLHKSESEGQRLREALSINSSLSALGKVIMALDPSLPSSFVPYRDSKLTRLLQNSLGGNSYTSLLATVHPRQYDYEECLSTLQFANRCRNVRNQPRVNYIDSSGADKERRIKRLMQEVADLKRALYTLQSTSAARMQRVLAELGVEGEVLPDGNFRTADGRVVSLGAIGGDGLGDDDLLDEGGYGGRGRGGAGGRPRTAKEIAAAREAENRLAKALKDKLSARKEELEQVKQRSKREAAELRSLLISQRKQLEDAKMTEAERALKLRSALQDAESSFGQQIGSLVEHNARLLSQQHAMLRSVPESLRINTKLLERAADIERVVRKEEETKRREELRALRKSCDREIASEAAKFAAFRAAKDAEVEEVIAGATDFKKRTTKEIESLSTELSSVFEYSAAMTTLVNDMLDGKHPVRQAASGLRAFTLPRSAVPRDPLATLSETTKVTAGLVAKHGRLGVTLPRGRAVGSAASVASTPRSAVGVVRAHREQRDAWAATDATEQASVGGDAGSTGAPAAAPRSSGRPPASAAPPRASANPRHHGRGAGGQRGGPGSARGRSSASVGSQEMSQTSSVSLGLGRVADVALGDLGLDRPLDSMSGEELAAHAEELRGFIAGGFREQIEEQVMNDLAEDSTVQYIRAVENEKEKYAAMWKEEAQKHKELRVAFSAQGRAMRKLSEEQERLARRRPQSAMSARQPPTHGYQRAETHGYGARAGRPSSALPVGRRGTAPGGAGGAGGARPRTSHGRY